jgi:hypothetical protein
VTAAPSDPAVIVPESYRCSSCGATGVKLWRQYQTFLERIELLCASCALKDQIKDGPVDDDGRVEFEPGRKTDQIGWLVPAVPAPGGTFWGYTSVPDDRVRWWRALPTYPQAATVTS